MMEVLEACIPERVGAYALAFEAAMNSWVCDNNFPPYGLDVVVERPPLLSPRGWRPARSAAGDRYWASRPNDEIDVRMWASIGGARFRDIPKVDNVPLACGCVHPDWLLDRFDLTPDIAYLWELRAYLAEIVHADDMTDDELMTFDRYVRLG